MARVATEELVAQLSEVLVDAVGSGASVRFMAGFTTEQAATWWRRVIGELDARAVLLVARDDRGVMGTVQLQPARAPNQPHRADVAKLLVHRRARGNGIARALMTELERHALEQKFTLLLLDTCKGSAAERLYASLG